MNFRNFVETVDLSKINQRKIIQSAARECDWSGGDGETYRYYAKSELYGDGDYEGGNQRDIERSAMRIMKEKMENQLYEKIWQYENLQDPIRLYREITINGNSFEEIQRNIELKRVGTSWTWKEDFACAHWGNFGNGYQKIVLYTELPSSNINWEYTLILNLHPSLGEDEQEIKVHEGQPITISKIRYKCEWKKVKLQGLT